MICPTRPGLAVATPPQLRYPDRPAVRRAARLAATVLITSALIASAALLSGAPAAHAQAPGPPLGEMLVIPGDGTDLTAIRLRTSGGCPQEADAYYARMVGKGFPPEGQIVTSNTGAGLSRTAGFDVYLAQIMRDFAALNGGVVLSGRYDITVGCIDSVLLTSFGDFTGSLEFTGPTAYTALGAAKPVGPAPPPLSIGADGGGLDLNAPLDSAAAPPGVDLPPGGAQPGAEGGAAPGPPGSAPAVAPAASSSNPDEPNLIPIVVIVVLVVIPVVWVVVFGLGRRRSS